MGIRAENMHQDQEANLKEEISFYDSARKDDTVSQRILRTFIIGATVLLFLSISIYFVVLHKTYDTRDDAVAYLDPYKGIALASGTDVSLRENYELDKRVTIKTALTAGATTFFGSLAAGVVFGPLGPALSPYIGAAGNYIVASLCAAASSGFGVYGGANAWEWWNGSGTAGNKREVYEDIHATMFGTGYEMRGGKGYTSDIFDILERYLGSNTSSLTHLAKFDMPTVFNGNITKRGENDTTEWVTWTYNSTNRFITTIAPLGHEPGAAQALALYLNPNSDILEKRYDHEWFSYSTYGMNSWLSKILKDQTGSMESQVGNTVGSWFVEQIQPCTEDECYGIANKGCLAAGDGHTPGVNSDIVGEYYYRSYGGIDNECDLL